MIVYFKRLSGDAVKPSKTYEHDAGTDMFSTSDVTIAPQSVAKIGTGLLFEIPERYYGKIESRSSLASRGIFSVGGVIDSTYRGEVQVLLHNSTKEPVFFPKGTKIAQMIVMPLPVVSFHETSVTTETERGTGGFGSTGK